MTRRAVCVGVGSFVDPTIPPLPGAEADARAVASALEQHQGFDAHDVKVLVGERATRENVLRALEWLVMLTSSGDGALLYLAGHGTRLPDRSGAAVGEALVAHDHDWQSCALRDEDLLERLRRAAPGASVGCVLDAGRGGSPLAAAELAPPRPAPGRFLWPPASVPSVRAAVSSLPLRPRLLERGEGSFAALLSCSAGEGAADTPAFGLFTRALCEALARVGSEASWDELTLGASEALRAAGGGQQPCLSVADALRGRPAFGFGRRPAPSAPPPSSASQSPASFGYPSPLARSWPASSAPWPPSTSMAEPSLASPMAQPSLVPPTMAPSTMAPSTMAPSTMAAGGFHQEPPLDSALSSFPPGDPSARGCDAFFGQIPFAPRPILPYRSLADALRVLYPSADAGVAARARQLAQSPRALAALGALSALDPGGAWADDASLAFAALSLAVALLFPGPIQDRVQLFHMTPAAQLSAIYAAACASGPGGPGGAWARGAAGAGARLAAAYGAHAASEASEAAALLVPSLDALAARVAPHAAAAFRALASSLSPQPPRPGGAAPTVIEPPQLYRLLGARLVAEACVLTASRG